MSPKLTSRPDFIIIGAMKSATSTLHLQLSRQPGFWMSEPKEPNFFSDEAVWAKGLDWYAGLFAGAAPDDLRGESSTHYTKAPNYPDCLSRMRAHVPDARLIYIMRHPVDRLISHYMHGWLEASMHGSIDEAVLRNPQLVDYGRYAMQLEPFLTSFGPDRILPVFFERLIRHPQQELERVCTFLAYAGSPVWYEDESQQNVSLERLRESPVRDAILNFPPFRAIRQNVIPHGFRARVKRAWQITNKPSLSDHSLEVVTKAFDADLSILSDWLGSDLTCSKFKETVSCQPLNWTQVTPRPAQSAPCPAPLPFA